MATAIPASCGTAIPRSRPRRFPRPCGTGMPNTWAMRWNSSPRAGGCPGASVASSGTFVAGREAAGVDNSSARNIDSEITAKLTTGTSPTVDTELRVYGYQALNPDTPLYPDTISGTNAAVTLTSTYQLSGGFLLLGSSAVSATSSIGYPIKCLSTAQAWGKEPKRWGLYITHNTAVALHATGTNHVLTYTSAFLTDT